VKRAIELRARSRQRATPGRVLLLFCGCLLLAKSGTAMMPDPSVSIGGDRDELTLIAEDVSLRDVLEYIAHHQQIAVQAHVALRDSISISVVAQPLPAILSLLLRDYSFTLQLSYDEAGINRLWIYPRDPALTAPLARPDQFGVAGIKTVTK
jgi:type II secretory pathway component HofQ